VSEVDTNIKDHLRALWVSLLPLYDPMPELPIWLVGGRRDNEFLYDAGTLIAGQHIDLPVRERTGTLGRIAHGSPPVRHVRYRRDYISDEHHAWTFVFSPGERA
jgi:hypothetical protein